MLVSMDNIQFVGMTDIIACICCFGRVNWKKYNLQYDIYTDY